MLLGRSDVLLLDNHNAPLTATLKTTRTLRFLGEIGSSTTRRLTQQGSHGATVELRSVLFHSTQGTVTVHAHTMGVVFATGQALLQNDTEAALWLTQVAPTALTLRVRDWDTIDAASQMSISLHLHFRNESIEWPAPGLGKPGDPSRQPFSGSQTWQARYAENLLLSE
jgi:hypothetical protein